MENSIEIVNNCTFYTLNKPEKCTPIECKECKRKYTQEIGKNKNYSRLL